MGPDVTAEACVVSLTKRLLFVICLIFYFSVVHYMIGTDFLAQADSPKPKS